MITTNVRSGLLIGWHWRDSITWRWAVTVHRHDRDCKTGPYRLKTNGGVLSGFNTPYFDIRFQSQPNMWRVK